MPMPSATETEFKLQSGKIERRAGIRGGTYHCLREEREQKPERAILYICGGGGCTTTAGINSLLKLKPGGL